MYFVCGTNKFLTPFLKTLLLEIFCMLWLLDEDEKRKKCKEMCSIALRLLEIFHWEERIIYNSWTFKGTVSP